MFGSRIYAKLVTFISDHLAREEAATEYTKLLGRAIQESISKITKEKPKLIK